MNRIVIIGAGFSGISCLATLKKHGQGQEIIIIDKSKFFNFLPVLPDVIGRSIDPGHLTYDLSGLKAGNNFRFINDEVKEVLAEDRQVITSSETIGFDYLAVCSGSETNFYNNEEARKLAFKLDNASDAGKIIGALTKNNFSNFLISGGGYTGVEVATNIRRYLNKKRKGGRVVIIERSPSILGPLPDWMKDYVSMNLRGLDIECVTNVTVQSVTERNVVISNGAHFDDAMLIWAAGVRTADFIQKLTLGKNPQGRIKVGADLTFAPGCFAGGDAALFPCAGGYLRMAVQFAIAQGRVIAANIINSIKARKMSIYKPLDLGYIIPMANNRACGNILGRDILGPIPVIMHYFMCVYRSYGLKNKLGLLGDLLKGG